MIECNQEKEMSGVLGGAVDVETWESLEHDTIAREGVLSGGWLVKAKVKAGTFGTRMLKLAWSREGMDVNRELKAVG